MLIDPRTIISAFVTALGAVKLPEAYDVEGAPQAAFQAVKIYDMEDLLKALEDLLVFKDRVAFVLLEDCEHDNELEGRVLTTQRNVLITVLAADRNWGNRQKALMGVSPAGPTATPGALLMGHLVVEALTGLMVSGGIVQPGVGTLLGLAGKERENAAGRIAWRQEFTVSAGRQKQELNRTAQNLTRRLGSRF